ncbi:MAG TPA: hypothetical protein VFZ78_09275, partial [Flavisolibacter sp.]
RHYVTEPGSFNDSVRLTYTGSQVTDARYNSSYKTFQYSGDRPVRITDYSNAGTMIQYYQFSYNSDGTLSSIESFQQVGASVAKVKLVNYTYTSGKLTKIASHQVSGGVVNPNAQEYAITWTGNNATQLVYTDNLFGYPPETITLSYDNQPNYLKPVGDYFWMYDASAATYLDETMLILYSTANNIIQISNSGFSVTRTYAVNAGQKLTGITWGNITETFVYECK